MPVTFVCAAVNTVLSGWLRKEINSLDDLKGMKMRFFGLGARVMDKFRAVTSRRPCLTCSLT